MRAALVALLAFVALAPLAAAQTIGQPLAGVYESSYTVYGRAIDSEGLPVRGGVAVVELEQEGVNAAPLRAGINCKGDFIVEFNLRHVEAKGKVKVTILGPNGQDNATVSQSLEPFFRRNDVLVALSVPWRQACRNEQDVWAVSASVRFRVLNRTEPYLVQDEEIHARPSTTIFKMRYEPPGGAPICPPHPQAEEQCELFQPDERGDIRYTFTLGQPFDAGGLVTITNVENENEEYTVEIDRASRLGVKYIETSGRGPPDILYETPASGLLLALGSSVLAAMAFSARRR